MDEMNAHIIQTWNERVPENGIVYALGNLAKEPLCLQEFLSSVNGTIRVIEGEYDQPIHEVYHSGSFGNLNLLGKDLYPVDVRDMDGRSQGIIISYWPMEEWPGMEGGVMHIYGRGERYGNDPVSNKLNASFPVWGGPLSFQTIVDLRADIEATQGNGRTPEDVMGKGATSEGG